MDKSRDVKTFNLDIAGCYIELNLKPTFLKSLKQTWEKIIMDYYHSNLLVNKPKFFHYRINFIEGRQIDRELHKGKSLDYFPVGKTHNSKTYNIFYSSSFFQLQIVIRNAIKNWLIKYCFFIHASAVVQGDSVILFLGRSGAGKSTAAQLVKKKYPIITDDIAIIKKENDSFYLYQTPFLEKELSIIRTKQRFSIKALFFIKKSEYFRKQRISDKKEIMKTIIRQIALAERNKKTQLALVEEFIYSTDEFYSLFFRKDSSQMLKVIGPVLEN